MFECVLAFNSFLTTGKELKVVGVLAHPNDGGKGTQATALLFLFSVRGRCCGGEEVRTGHCLRPFGIFARGLYTFARKSPVPSILSNAGAA